MTATITETSTTTINGIVLQLDNLHSAYAAILEQAKAQLEELDLTEQQADAIGRRMLDNSGRREQLASVSVDALRDEINHHYDHGFGGEHWLLRRLAALTTERLCDRQTDDIRLLLRQHLAEDEFRRSLEVAIERQLSYPTGELSRVLRNSLRQAIAGLYDADDIRQLLDVPTDAEYRSRAEQLIDQQRARIADLTIEVARLRNELNDRIDRIERIASAPQPQAQGA